MTQSKFTASPPPRTAMSFQSSKVDELEKQLHNLRKKEANLELLADKTVGSVGSQITIYALLLAGFSTIPKANFTCHLLWIMSPVFLAFSFGLLVPYIVAYNKLKRFHDYSAELKEKLEELERQATTFAVCYPGGADPESQAFGCRLDKLNIEISDTLNSSNLQGQYYLILVSQGLCAACFCVFVPIACIHLVCFANQVHQ